jgi:hypothetical protein
MVLIEIMRDDAVPVEAQAVDAAVGCPNILTDEEIHAAEVIRA